MARMKRGVLLINTSRDAIVDMPAVIAIAKTTLAKVSPFAASGRAVHEIGPSS